MTKEIKHADQRVVVLKMHLEIMRVFCMAYFKGPRFGSSAADLALVGAIFVGQAEGRPMNASKLADFAGLPRATVIRKLTVLVRMGIVIRSGDSFEVCTSVTNSESVVAASRVVRKHIMRTADKLSRMDTEPIDKTKWGGLGMFLVIFSEGLASTITIGVCFTCLHGQ